MKLISNKTIGEIYEDFLGYPVNWHKNPTSPVHKHEVEIVGMLVREVLSLRNDKMRLIKDAKVLREWVDSTWEDTLYGRKVLASHNDLMKEVGEMRIDPSCENCIFLDKETFDDIGCTNPKSPVVSISESYVDKYRCNCWKENPGSSSI